MQLALRLGRSLRELLATVSSEELTMWRAFDMREPIGDWRQDLGAGVIASTLANVNRDSKKKQDAFTPNDFMPLAPRKPESVGKKLLTMLKSIGGRKP